MESIHSVNSYGVVNLGLQSKTQIEKEGSFARAALGLSFSSAADFRRTRVQGATIVLNSRRGVSDESQTIGHWRAIKRH